MGVLRAVLHFLTFILDTTLCELPLRPSAGPDGLANNYGSLLHTHGLFVGKATVQE